MKSELTLIPSLSVHPSSIVLYNEVNWSNGRPAKRDFDKENEVLNDRTSNFKGKENKANGLISKHAKKKIDRSIDYLLTVSKTKKVQSRYRNSNFTFKIAFITLTLPSTQTHDDNTIKKTCFDPFLLEIKKYYKVQNYVWRAEKQKNGNIHFHIIIDSFIPYQELKDRWNRIVNRLGYVSQYQKNMKKYYAEGFKVNEKYLDKWNLAAQKRAYEKAKKNDYQSPNSTDVHSVRKIKNLKAYVSKYMIKNEIENQKLTAEEKEKMIVKGRIWGCNHELSDIKGAQLHIDTKIDEELKKLVKDSNCKVFSSDYFTVLYIDYKKLELFGASTLFLAFSEYLFDKFNYSEQFSF
jgi:hypothetical protein